jgi:hypothetical protein
MVLLDFSATTAGPVVGRTHKLGLLLLVSVMAAERILEAFHQDPEFTFP